ncbi:scarecrow-like protein 33 [Rhododendron vialii]|uniref:scarecrow-like protein 33 n=1 Tax=Rhododendron vialii TaxID=182163 RepID=UPI00265FB205|nr:scarecrow-like protein 33 [Rhododendron vialii]
MDAARMEGLAFVCYLLLGTCIELTIILIWRLWLSDQGSWRDSRECGEHRLWAVELHKIMDPHFSAFSYPSNGFEFDDGSFSPTFSPSENLANTFPFQDDPGDLSLMDKFLPPVPNPGFAALTSGGSSEVDSPHDSDFSDAVLKVINTTLMEENMEQTPSTFHDPLALQATEKSLYDVIGENYPVSPNQPPLYFNQNSESPDEYLFSTSSEQSINSTTNCGNSIDTQQTVDPGAFRYCLKTTTGSSTEKSAGTMNSSMSSHPVPKMFIDSQSIWQFRRGVEEASKFLPSNNGLVIDVESHMMPPGSMKEALDVAAESGKDERENSPNGSRGRKNHHHEDSELEEVRTTKFSAICVEESELSDMFDKVLLCDVKAEPTCCDADEEVESGQTKTIQQNGQPHRSKGRKSRTKKQESKNEVVDLVTLLMNCAQSVAAEDRRSAYEQLKNIRQHSSPSGDGFQRLANVFANALEARLAGTGSQLYAALASKRISATEKLKAYQLYFSASPFKKICMLFANQMIEDLAINSKRKKLHVVDFGIQYGFQWPMLIQLLSGLPGGAPDLRITGIELPQPGFRPTEFVEETGRRLAKYCERFNVLFQYHAIAQKWETIKIEELNLYDDEALAVNCHFTLKNRLRDSDVEGSPRDALLMLIRKMNPDIFVHTTSNGSYSPFFLNRFREALFHYSSLFDMFDTTLLREDQDRRNFEQEFYGREVMNVIACEGLERVERPETYKQWQVRNTNAGFRILPLKQDLMKNLRVKVKAGYHKDFLIEEDGQWMLQGWKGRIFCASSCWVPS